jgi:hypothetical protein
MLLFFQVGSRAIEFLLFAPFVLLMLLDRVTKHPDHDIIDTSCFFLAPAIII